MIYLSNLVTHLRIMLQVCYSYKYNSEILHRFDVTETRGIISFNNIIFHQNYFSLQIENI